MQKIENNCMTLNVTNKITINGLVPEIFPKHTIINREQQGLDQESLFSPGTGSPGDSW